jgi:hypothetical protein
MDTIFAAADISGLAANVSTLLIAFVGVSLLFLGYRSVIKALRADSFEYEDLGGWEGTGVPVWYAMRQERRIKYHGKYRENSPYPGVDRWFNGYRQE